LQSFATRQSGVEQRASISFSLLRLASLVLAMIVLAGGVGCRGDNASDDDAKKAAAEKEEKEKKEKEEKKKPPFEISRVIARPDEFKERDTGPPSLKVGHWASVGIAAQSNERDFRGELLTQVLDSTGAPVEVNGTPFHLGILRPAILPKEQPRLL